MIVNKSKAQGLDQPEEHRRPRPQTRDQTRDPRPETRPEDPRPDPKTRDQTRRPETRPEDPRPDPKTRDQRPDDGETGTSRGPHQTRFNLIHACIKMRTPPFLLRTPRS